MNIPNHQDEFDLVKRIIDRERGEALAFFRKKNFESRVNRRLEMDSKSKSSSVFFLRKPALVLSALVLVCCVVTVIIFQILAPSPHEKSVRIIEEFLLQNTNLQEVLAEEITPEQEQKSMTSSFEEELECWQSPRCRKKYFSQIINVFKEV